LHRPIDLAMGDTRATPNNDADNGDERAKTGECAKIGLIPH
jgi:hypothetical protein